MRNDWKLYTTHEGISSIRNSELDEKNYYRMKVFLKNYFKERYADNIKKQTSLIYSIVMSVSGNQNGKNAETSFLCNVNVDQRKIALSWADATGVCVSADSREGNCIIRELYKVLKDNCDNEFWKICV
jgi:hypothetical protein